ncbi:ATP-binding cassette domain-containing protein [Paenibacillus sp. GCM10027626]|uniref:ATP-binding cassette domain-containing protein n=1 Tax=Paenibacillus sp. GCM10027626 TaxID=3273411 RepID=UPI003625A27F
MMDIYLENASCLLAAGAPYEIKAIEGLTAHIPAGQFVAIMGPSGSGKTTFVQMIGGLIPPHSGELRVGPYQLTKKADRRRLWKGLGCLFQFPEHQVLEDTVFQHISAGLNRLDMKPEWIAERVKQSMEAVGLDDAKFKELSPIQVSWGELRRIALAGVLVAEPEILILDEPTSGLDGCERNRILSLLKRTHEKKKMTVLYITHRLEEALEYSDRILVLAHGELFADFLPCEIRTRWQQLEQIGFAKTPLLRYIDMLERRFALNVPDNIYKEADLVSFLASLNWGD